MGKRTKVDFSKHEIIETHFQNEHHSLDVWDMKAPDSEYYHRVKFINSCGVLTITGDFGRWSFCREFHPSKDGGVSDGYWNEKLSILSKQEYAHFDSEGTKKELKKLVRSGLKDYGYTGEKLKEAKEWFKSLIEVVDDEYEYIYEAYRGYERPSFIDHEDIPFVKTQYIWLSIVYDAFEELCKRMK